VVASDRDEVQRPAPAVEHVDRRHSSLQYVAVALLSLDPGAEPRRSLHAPEGEAEPRRAGNQAAAEMEAPRRDDQACLRRAAADQPEDAVVAHDLELPLGQGAG